MTHDITVLHRDFAKIIHVPFIPRIGDTLIIDGNEYQVKSIVIDTDENDVYFNL